MVGFHQAPILVAGSSRIEVYTDGSALWPVGIQVYKLGAQVDVPLKQGCDMCYATPACSHGGWLKKGEELKREGQIERRELIAQPWY